MPMCASTVRMMQLHRAEICCALV